MGEALGTQFDALWQEVAQLHLNWGEFVELFGSKPKRIDLLNQIAPQFFSTVQDVFWQATLLHIARLTDASEFGKGKLNLKIQNLPKLVSDHGTNKVAAELVETALKETEFCRDWRNRYIAHRDLDLAVNEKAIPLEAASRKQVYAALKAISNVLNSIEAHYIGAETKYEMTATHRGAVSLLHVLHYGLREKARIEERVAQGLVSKDDYPRDL